MLDPQWVFAAVALNMAGSLRYAVATLKGRVRPNLVTWSLWACAPLIGFFAQLDSGVGLPSLLTLSAGLGPLVVTVAGLVTKHARAHLGPFDVVCGAVALLALGVWLGLGEAPLAVLVAVLADGTAALPTLCKAWRDPWSEDLVFYMIVAIGATVTLLTVTSWQLHEWAFAGYILLLSSALVGIISARRGAPETAQPA